MKIAVFLDEGEEIGGAHSHQTSVLKCLSENLSEDYEFIVYCQKLKTKIRVDSLGVRAAIYSNGVIRKTRRYLSRKEFITSLP